MEAQGSSFPTHCTRSRANHPYHNQTPIIYAAFAIATLRRPVSALPPTLEPRLAGFQTSGKPGSLQSATFLGIAPIRCATTPDTEHGKPAWANNAFSPFVHPGRAGQHRHLRRDSRHPNSPCSVPSSPSKCKTGKGVDLLNPLPAKETKRGASRKAAFSCRHRLYAIKLRP